MATQTPRQRLATLILGRDVLILIEEMRANGDTWPAIRNYVCDATDGEIDVTWQAVRAWHVMAQAQSGAA